MATDFYYKSSIRRECRHHRFSSVYIYIRLKMALMRPHIFAALPLRFYFSPFFCIPYFANFTSPCGQPMQAEEVLGA